MPIPEDDPVLVLAKRWIEKLDRPDNASHRMAYTYALHDPSPELPNGAARSDDAGDDAIVEAYRRTSDIRMKRLAQAVKLLGKD